MRDLLTAVETGDEARYDLYLRELQDFDLVKGCRRDFFRHMAQVVSSRIPVPAVSPLHMSNL